MHDPWSVAFEIWAPWFVREHRPWPRRLDHLDDDDAWRRMSDSEKARCRRHYRDGMRPRFITIWHIDPELHGDDDSCRRVRLSRKRRQRLKWFAWSEASNPYFLRCAAEEWDRSDIEAEALYRALILHVADIIGVRITFDKAAKIAAMDIHRPDCCPRTGVFCFKVGYHANAKTDRREDREERFYGIMHGIACGLLRRRRWRWHVHHWHVQISPLQRAWCYLFRTCDSCKRRIKHGPAISTCWETPRIAWYTRIFRWLPWYCVCEACSQAGRPVKTEAPPMSASSHREDPSAIVMHFKPPIDQNGTAPSSDHQEDGA